MNTPFNQFEEVAALRRVQEEGVKLDAGIGVLSDGITSNPRAINGVPAMIAKQKENSYDFFNNNLSLQSADFIANLNFNDRLIRQMSDLMLEPNINTYDEKVKAKIEMYAEVISDNYHQLRNVTLPAGELKSEVILERVATQKSQIEQFAGRLSLVNPELSQSVKEKFDVKLYNEVVDVAKNVSITDETYTPTFKMR